jgi:short-subunit dehydrogenase
MTARPLALITGASSGIGETFARKLAAQGYDLIITARREERLRQLAAELMDRHGIEVEVLPADLSKREGMEKVENRAASASGLEILVNNAGFGLRGTFAEIPVEKSQSMLDVHVTATMRITRAALPGMIERGKGYVINVSSVAGFMSFGGRTMYSATKAFLNVFSTNLSNELRGTGVKIQTLCPGFTVTEFHNTEEIKGFDRSRYPSWSWQNVDYVVGTSLKALDRDRVIVVPGAFYQTAAYILRSPIGRTRALFTRRAKSMQEGK